MQIGSPATPNRPPSRRQRTRSPRRFSPSTDHRPPRPTNKESNGRNSKIILAAGVLASTAALAITGAASATATTKTEHFSLITTSTTSPDAIYSVITTGAFTDGGTATKTSTGLALRFPSGTITLDTKKRHRKLRKIETATACLETQTTSGSYTIAGGTGAYHGLSGSGHSSVTATFVEPFAHGTCSNNLAAVQVIATATGPVSLP